MTLQEFKAWFEGFCENLDGRPNEKQWKRIKARVKAIDGRCVTPVIVERWRDRYVPGWPYGVWSAGSNISATTGGNLPKPNHTVWLSTSGEDGHATAVEMLADMGKEEARSLS